MMVLPEDLKKELALRCLIDRISQRFTLPEVAAIAGVSEDDVRKFESDEPLKIPAMRKLIGVYNSLDVHGLQTSSPHR